QVQVIAWCYHSLSKHVRSYSIERPLFRKKRFAEKRVYCSLVRRHWQRMQRMDNGQFRRMADGLLRKGRLVQASGWRNRLTKYCLVWCSSKERISEDTTSGEQRWILTLDVYSHWTALPFKLKLSPFSLSVLFNMAKGAVAASLRHRFKLPEGFRMETWFPAHMFSGMKKMQAKLRSVDCIVEVHDARIPFTGRNSEFNRLLFKGRPHLLLLNKADLAGPLHRREVAERLTSNGEEREVIFGSFKGSDKMKTSYSLMHQLRRAIEGEMRFHREGLTEYNVMIVGIPNVGKSSVINALRECFTDLNVNACRVGSKPGITRTVAGRVRISDRPLIYMFDTPGVLTPEVYVNRRIHPESVLKLGLCECLPDERVGVELLADYLLYLCNKQDRLAYVSQLQLDGVCDDIHHVLRHLAEKEELKKRIVLYGNAQTLLDLEQAAKKFIQLFRRGHLGGQFLDVDALT
ncbi:hypothetical protein M513_07634, partial [Trichuris suis]